MRYEPGTEGQSGRYVLSTGRWFYAVSPRLSLLGDVIGNGYDGLLDDESVHRAENDEGGDFTPAERREIAAHVIAEWSGWAADPVLAAGPLYETLNVAAFAPAFVAWFREAEAATAGAGVIAPDPPAGILGLDVAQLPEGFRPLASALTYALRPEGTTPARAATAFARIAVASALATWLYLRPR